ncbi:MAG: ribonuclease H-like domain-containing protein, partial [Nitrososphaera sp.]|nr:ribonuclease H-like domain-containing protein [Nitrososphaera sp.]
TQGGSVRGAADDLGLPYGQVRGYVKHMALPEVVVNEHLRILFFDVETAPLLGHVWHPYGDFMSIDQLLNDSFMLTWSAKWNDSSKVYSDRLTSEEAIAQDDSRIVESLATLMRQTDIVVAHNGDSFDVPVVNGRLFLLGLEPLPPIRTIDTYKLAKRNFHLAMNKLDYLADRLGLGRKIKTEFTLWRECYHGDEAALAQMEKYNIKDTVLLERIFNRMKPYVTNLPRLVNGPAWACPFCGSSYLTNVNQYGEQMLKRTNMSTYTMWYCQNCKKYSRSKSLAEKRSPLHPL